jgi:hypothetical protein
MRVDGAVYGRGEDNAAAFLQAGEGPRVSILTPPGSLIPMERRTQNAVDFGDRIGGHSSTHPLRP